MSASNENMTQGTNNPSEENLALNEKKTGKRLSRYCCLVTFLDGHAMEFEINVNYL